MEQRDNALLKVNDDALTAKLEINDFCQEMYNEGEELNMDSLQHYIITYFPDFTLRFLNKPQNTDKENELLAKIEVKPKAYVFEKNRAEIPTQTYAVCNGRFGICRFDVLGYLLYI